MCKYNIVICESALPVENEINIKIMDFIINVVNKY